MSDSRDTDRQWPLVGKFRTQGGGLPAIEVGLAEVDFAGCAAPDVVLIHVGEALLELERHALAHDADGVDRVDEGLRLGREEVTFKHARLHRSPPLLSPEEEM